MVGDGLGSTLLGRWVIYGNGQLLLLSIRLLGRQGFSVDQLQALWDNFIFPEILAVYVEWIRAIRIQRWAVLRYSGIELCGWISATLDNPFYDPVYRKIDSVCFPGGVWAIPVDAVRDLGRAHRQT